MTWFFLTLGAALCWGIAQVLIKKGFDHLSPLWNNIINNALTLFIWILPVLFINNFTGANIADRNSRCRLSPDHNYSLLYISL